MLLRGPSHVQIPILTHPSLHAFEKALLILLMIGQLWRQVKQKPFEEPDIAKMTQSWTVTREGSEAHTFPRHLWLPQTSS